MEEYLMRSGSRRNDQVRNAKITRNYIKHAEGSVLIEVGDTKVICTASIEDKVPPFLKGSGEGWITAEYNMLPRSTATRKPRDISRLKIDGRTMEIQRLNSMLDDIKANIRSHFHNQLMRDSYVTPESVKNALLGKEEEANTIISFFTQHNAQYKKKVEAGEATPKTYSRYELTKLRLIEYMKDEYRVSDLPIRQINKVFIENFYLYIIKNHDCSPNTAMKFIQRFRTVVNFAQATGLITADPFAHYKLKFEYIERGYLDKDEISRLCNKEFASKRLEQVRDIFIFSCYTGLSYVDICELTRSDIRMAFDDNLWIIKKRHKTKVTSNIRLLDIPKAILNKYEGKLKNGQLLPVISNQKMNDYLKEIATVCGIDKNVTFHLARHTFATTITLANGVPIESVSKMLGHTDIRTTQIYAKVIDAKLSNDMELLAQKINTKKVAAI